MKLIAILRVKDEILHIEKCLSRLTELVDEIVILDNGSTDGTLEMYSNFTKVVEIIHTVGFDEGRDKIMLHEAAKKRKPDWILWLDGDEVFEPALNRSVLEGYMSSSFTLVSFRMNHFWLSTKKFRVDGNFYAYTLAPMPRMWKNLQGTYFSDKKIHNGGIRGLKGKSKVSIYRILHYGYTDKHKVDSKVKLYENVDKNGSRTYDHIRVTAKTTRLPFFVFSNVAVNHLYLLVYNVICNVLFILLRLYRKLLRIVGHD